MMKFAELATELSRHAEFELGFEFGDTRIRRGCHLTEVLHVTVDAIDCGGAVDRWTERVLQLVEPAHDDGARVMSAGQLIDTLQRAQARVPLPADSGLLLEYRPAGADAAQRFRVTEVRAGQPGQLWVRAAGARTPCQVAARSPSADGDRALPGGCCPATAAITAAGSTRRCCA